MSISAVGTSDGKNDLYRGFHNKKANGRLLTIVNALVTKCNAITTGAAGFLTADASGRSVMASNYFDLPATTDAKFAAGSLNGSRIANLGIGTAQLAANAVTGAKVANATLDATQVLVAAAGNTVGAIAVEYIIAVPDAATGTVDVTVDATVGKITVTSIRILKNASAGGVSDTIQVSNGTTATPLCEAVSINVAANTICTPTTMLTANAVITSAAFLRVTRTKASAANVGCTVIVHGYRTA